MTPSRRPCPRAREAKPVSIKFIEKFCRTSIFLGSLIQFVTRASTDHAALHFVQKHVQVMKKTEQQQIWVKTSTIILILSKAFSGKL